MGQKFLFVLIGCMFVAIVGAVYVNKSLVKWPIYEEPTFSDITTIDDRFEPPKGYIKSNSVNPVLNKGNTNE